MNWNSQTDASVLSMFDKNSNLEAFSKGLFERLGSGSYQIVIALI